MLTIRSPSISASLRSGMLTTTRRATLQPVSKPVASGFSRTSGPPEGGHHVGFETLGASARAPSAAEAGAAHAMMPVVIAAIQVAWPALSVVEEVLLTVVLPRRGREEQPGSHASTL